jgi:DNA-binding beta-propeller fold protein YncE
MHARTKTAVAPAPEPTLEMDGGRRLSFERNFNSARQVIVKRGFWTKVVDIVAGEPAFRAMVRPYSVAVDSHGRVIVTDPGSFGVHVFDFDGRKYKFLSHPEGKDPLKSPQCVAVDKQDNIYVTDPEAGKIFVFAANGKFQRVIGSLKGGEGFFKRPTGIAVDSDTQRIYVTDTWRDQIFMLDLQGNLLRTIGKRGHGNGEFNLPTELKLTGDALLVVDAMNFRVQTFDRAGSFRSALGQAGDGRGELFRPKGIGVDSEGHLYLADGSSHTIQVFDRDGQLLYWFGKGAGVGDFLLPAGLAIDLHDRIFVVDSYHRRVQVFQYSGLGGVR